MPEIKFFPETHVAFVSESGPYGDSIPRGFKRLFDWMLAHKVQPIGPSLAIFYDDPTKVASKNRRCDLCAPVGPRVNGSGEVRTKEIGGWTVATILYEGDADAKRAYNEIYKWLRKKGYHEADVPVEKYLSGLGEELRAEVAVPVFKKELKAGRVKASAAKTAKRTAKTARKVTKALGRKKTVRKRTTKK